MRKWLIRGLGACLGVFIALVVLLAVVNGRDTDLHPDVVKALARDIPVTERQKQAYFYVLGLAAGEEAEPEKKGAELFARKLTSEELAKMREARPFNVEFNSPCPNGICTVESIEKDPTLLQALEKNQKALQRYLHLLQYEEGATLRLPSNEEPFNIVSALPYAPHRLFLLQLAQWFKQGGSARALDMIASSNHYFRSFYRRGSLLERILAIVAVGQNAKFLKAELARNPKLRLTQDVVDSFAAPDTHEVMYGAMDEELQTVNLVLKNTYNLEAFEMSSISEKPGHSWKALIPARLFYRPNDTLNHYYEIVSQSLSSDCPASMEFVKCVPAAEWMYPKVWGYIDNPVGRLMVKLMSVNVFSIRGKMEQRADEILQAKEDFQTRM